MIGEGTAEGFDALTLGAGDAGLEVAFVPEAGMVGCSLTHRGEEVLGQRGGLSAYIEKRSTMGIPLLYPWANRLGSTRFSVAGREVDLECAAPAPKLDRGGLPIHGLLTAAADWEVDRHAASDEGGVLAASFDFGAERGLLGGFPFPHELSLEATLAGPTLTIATRVHASGGAQVPVAFGYHPYFCLPGVPRAEWELEAPVGERLRLDDRMLPTGEREPASVEAGPLGSRTFDDGYAAPEEGAPFVLSGGGRRIEVTFGDGYEFAQVYAPAGQDLIAFEPMTAPTNALVSGDDLPLVEPGESYEATFSVSITDTS